MLDVGQFVGEHAFELLLGQDLENAFRRGHRRVTRIAAGRERVRRRLGDDVAARLRETGARRELADDAVERVVGAHFLAPYIFRTILSENQYERSW